MREGIADLITVVRCSRLAVSLPKAMTSAYSGSVRAAEDFDRVIIPIVEEIYEDSDARARVCAALCVTSMTVNFVVLNYAKMAGLPFNGELSVLAGAFARLYDDMMDNSDDPDLDLRLARLFSGRRFAPATAPERLLQRLHQAIDRRLGRPKDAPIHDMLMALHECQTLSHEQKNPAISGESLAKITRGKGGLANVTLLALMQPEMSVPERELIMELGEAFQLLDDYLDQDDDRRDGIVTLITKREATLADVGARLRALRGRLFAFYGAPAARPFVTTLYLMMVAVYVKRHRSPARRRARPGPSGDPRAAVRFLVGDGEPATIAGSGPAPRASETCDPRPLDTL